MWLPSRCNVKANRRLRTIGGRRGLDHGWTPISIEMGTSLCSLASVSEGSPVVTSLPHVSYAQRKSVSLNSDIAMGPRFFDYDLIFKLRVSFNSS